MLRLLNDMNYMNDIMNDYAICNSVKSFLLNKDFLLYVFDENEGRTQYWATFLNTHPESVWSFNRAKFILQNLDDPTLDVNKEELEELKSNINRTLAMM